MSKIKPAILILSKKGREDEHMFFYDHNDAMDTAEDFQKHGWGWKLVAPQIFQVGETPKIQKKLL